MALDLTQTATENGGLTGKDVLFSAVTSFGGDLVGAAKTNSTARNQLIDGATDNRAIKDAVGDSLTDNKAVKNAIALASGILSGLGYGDNTRAALMTRGLMEMTRFGVAMGGKKETFMGMTGIGDLIVTCTSLHSRNFQAGYEIGKAGTAKIFWETNTKTVEGVRTAKAVHEKARELGIDMPIVNEIYAVLFENKNARESAKQLMTRDLKSEMVF